MLAYDPRFQRGLNTGPWEITLQEKLSLTPYAWNTLKIPLKPSA